MLEKPKQEKSGLKEQQISILDLPFGGPQAISYASMKKIIPKNNQPPLLKAI
jgi:hypothetical protein